MAVVGTYTEEVTLTVINCGKCAATYAINERFREKCLQDGTGWHCPYCEVAWGYFGNSEAKRLKEQAEAAERRLAYERSRHDQTRAELRETEARRRGEKAAKTRIKNRVAKGVCPCCARYFVNLHRHMAGQHPDFVVAGPAAAE